MATWGTYEAGLKRIPPEQAVRAMNRLVAPPGAHRSVPMVWGWSAMPPRLDLMRLRDGLAIATRSGSGRIFVPSKRCRSRHRAASPRSMPCAVSPCSGSSPFLERPEARSQSLKDKAPTDECRDGRSGGHMRVTLLKFAAPLEQFSRARVGLATHRTASLENTDVALACFNFYRSASRIRGPERSSGSALEIGWRHPQNGCR